MPGFIVIFGLILITYTETTYWLFIFFILLALAIKSKRINNRKILKENKNAPSNIKVSSRLLPDKEILSRPIDKLSWREFERLIYLYYEHLGYKPQMTKEGADGGIDLIYTNPKTHEKVAVQIKHHKKPIGVNVIRETDNAARRNYKIYLTEIVTSGRFTQDALREVDNNKGMEVRSSYWIETKIIPWKTKVSHGNS